MAIFKSSLDFKKVWAPSKKFLFLEATVPFADDSITNLVKDDLGNAMLYHTWYARAYGANEKHTKRIDAIMSRVSIKSETSVEPIIFKDLTFAFRKYCKKQYGRVTQKLKLILKQ